MKEEFEIKGTVGTISVKDDVLEIALTPTESEIVDNLVKANYSKRDYERYIKEIATAGMVNCSLKYVYAEDWNVGLPGFKPKGAFYLLNYSWEDTEFNRWVHSWVTLKKEGDTTIVECEIHVTTYYGEKLKLVGVDCSEFEFLTGPVIGGNY